MALCTNSFTHQPIPISLILKCWAETGKKRTFRSKKTMKQLVTHFTFSLKPKVGTLINPSVALWTWSLHVLCDVCSCLSVLVKLLSFGSGMMYMLFSAVHFSVPPVLKAIHHLIRATAGESVTVSNSACWFADDTSNAIWQQKNNEFV